MATLRLTFVLNEGRVGIPLDKLAGIASDTKEFLAMVVADLNLPGEEWIAVDFKNGSVVFDCKRTGLDNDSLKRGQIGLKSIFGNLPSEHVEVRSETRLKYGQITKRIDSDERIKIILHEDSNGDSDRVYELSREKAQQIEETYHQKVQYYGEIQGYVHSFYKEARRPKLVVRDLATRALVDCFFKQEMYEAAIDTMSEPNAVIFVEGTVTENLCSGVIESIEVSDFHLAPQFDLEFFESFIGSKPSLTGDITSEQLIRSLRDEEDAGGRQA
jgi:hypothetical protein